MTDPNIPLEHHVASGSNPETPTCERTLPAGPESSVHSLVLLRRDTNGVGH